MPGEGQRNGGYNGDRRRRKRGTEQDALPMEFTEPTGGEHHDGGKPATQGRDRRTTVGDNPVDTVDNRGQSAGSRITNCDDLSTIAPELETKRVNGHPKEVGTLNAESTTESTAESAGGSSGSDLARDALRAAQQAAKARGNGPRRGRANGRGQGDLRRRRRRWSGAGADDRDPQTFGALAARLAGERGWRDKLTGGRVLADWERLVGADVAQHATPLSLKDGELSVRAESTAWATQLRLLQRQLLAEIAAGVGDGVVTKIKVAGPAAPSWRHGYRHVPGRGPRDTYG